MDLDKPFPLALALPCEAGVEILQVSDCASASVAWRVKAKAVGAPSCDSVTKVETPSVMVGASFASATVSINVGAAL